MSAGKRSLFVALALAMPGISLRAEEPPPARGMVAFDIVIAEFRPDSKTDIPLDAGEKALAQIKELESKGKIGSITRFHITSLDQQQARIQMGERAAVAVGVSRTVAGRFGGGGAAGDDPPARPSVTNYQMENYGTLVSILPRISAEGAVTAQLNIERSRPAGLGGAKDKEKDDGGSPIPPRSTTLTTQTAVQLKSDQTVAVGGLNSESGQFVILVTAKVTKFSTKE